MAQAASPELAQEPENEAKPAPSGRLLLRMPRALHAELTSAAEREGVSLNQFITSALGQTIGWSNDPDASVRAAREPQAARHARLVVVALFANVAVIGLAAIAAIVLLVLAWQG